MNVKALNRAVGRLSGARLDLWESRYVGGKNSTRRARKTAKRDARRAARRLPLEMD